MRRLDIDFSPSPRHGNGLDVALLALGLMATGLTSWSYLLMDERNEVLADRMGTLQRQIDRARLAWADATANSASLGKVATQGTEKQNWGRLFERIEGSVDETVTFLSLQARAADGGIEILAEAQDGAAMFAFMSRLAQEGQFGAITLRHQEVVADHPHRPVRFGLSARLEHDQK